MAFQRPTLTDLITRIESDYTSRLTGGGTLLRRAVVKVLARVHAGAMHLLYGFADFISKQIMPDTASSEYLKRWANIWDVIQKSATYTTFNVTFTGTEGLTIAKDSELSRSDGVLYAATADAIVTGGIATVSCIAKTPGSDPNVSTGMTLSLTTPIAGISSQGMVSATGRVDGVDLEDDSALLSRLLTRIQSPPHGGNATDYETWALEVPGVTRAWALPLYTGAGTIALTFVRDNDADSIIPGTSEVAEVQAYIDARRPVTASFTAFAPTPVPLNFTISGITDPAVQAAVQAELADLIRREAEPAGTLLLSHIREAISNAKGETDNTLISPSANVTTTAGQITTMGAITWA